MEEKKISVIIPCYNVSLFVDRCMESLERQKTVHTLFPDFWNNDLLVRPETKRYLELIDFAVKEDNIRLYHEFWLPR